MTDSFRLTLIWIAASLVAVLMALNTSPASYVDGEYVPVGNDSFYHARRILDVATNARPFYEFDDRIHAPEGSLLTWPWAYDYGMAMAVKLGVEIGVANDPMRVLAHLPVLFVTLSVALVIGIARRLGLSLWATTLAAFCFACLPITQGLHGVGVVDHHFAENAFTLAALFCGLSWFQRPERIPRAVACGIVLGVAPAFQNGLFILQLPLVAAFLILWARGIRMPRRPTALFGIALVAATLLALLPSQPFAEGRFEFYLFSWFHLYIAAGTACVVYATSRARATPVSIAVMALLGIVALLPLLQPAVMGTTFIAGRLPVLSEIVEARSLLRIVRMQGPGVVIDYYSALIVLAPITVVGCVWYLFRRQPTFMLTYFCLASLLGLILMFVQFRLHVFGSYALFVPLILTVDRWSQLSTARRRIVAMSALTTLTAVAYVPAAQHQLFKPRPLGNDIYYGRQRPIFAALADVCRTRPGIVLAGSDAGHYIRFHTECSVIADNFLMTPQHEEKYAMVVRALDTPPAELLRSDFPARYILVSMADVASYPLQGNLTLDPATLGQVSPRLAMPLLFAAPQMQHPRLKLISEVPLAGDAAFARLYEVLPRN